MVLSEYNRYSEHEHNEDVGWGEDLSFDEDQAFDEEVDLSEYAAIILAAGEGARFGGNVNKLLSPHKGKPIVCWAVEAALAVGFGDVYVVEGAVSLDAILPKEITLIHNESWENGQGCSLNVGIMCAQNSGYKTAVVGLGDAPLIPTSAWEIVAETPGSIVTAVYNGKRSPPVKLEESVWTMLPLSGDEGARLLMRKRPDLVVEAVCEGNPIDVDTKEDLADL